jgi:beta-glucosidase-like glycosyl hydrolase
MGFCDASKPVSARAKDLVARLNLTEKFQQLSTYSFAKAYCNRFTPPVPRIGLPGYTYHTEGLHGMRDGYISGLNTTLFPQVTAMAATANASLIHEMARVMGTEARALMNVNLYHLFNGGRGGNCTPGGPGGVGGKCTGNSTSIQTRGAFLSVYGPTMNIIRDPRWGRAQESVSEDPYLNGLYAASFVNGLQGDVKYADQTVGKPLLAAATCKHLAVYNLEMVNYGGEHWTRHRFQANVTAQELEETYLPAFRACVEAGNPQQVMCSYNSIAVTGGDHPYNSTPACLNRDMMHRQMRTEWGFEGSVVSDCDASSDAHFAHHWGPGIGDGGNASAAATVAAGLSAGCDMDCGSFYTDYGPEAAAQGLLSNSTIDLALERIFSMRLRLGEFDPPGTVPFDSLGSADSDSAAHRDSALRAAREAIVLLNNSNGILPLDLKSKVRSIATHYALTIHSLCTHYARCDPSRASDHSPMSRGSMVGLKTAGPRWVVRATTPLPSPCPRWTGCVLALVLMACAWYMSRG